MQQAAQLMGIATPQAPDTRSDPCAMTLAVDKLMPTLAEAHALIAGGHDACSGAPASSMAPPATNDYPRTQPPRCAG